MANISCVVRTATVRRIAMEPVTPFACWIENNQQVVSFHEINSHNIANLLQEVR